MRIYFSAIGAALFLLVAHVHAQTGESGARWIATWSAAMQTPLIDTSVMEPTLAKPITVQDQTIRQNVHISIGGSALRVRISNVLGKSALRIGAASAAEQAEGAAVRAGSLHPLKFGGEAGITIPAGAVVVSDPVEWRVPAQSTLTISLYVPGSGEASSQLQAAHQTSYVGAGDVTAADSFEPSSTITSWYWLSGVEVRKRSDAATVVAFGDSITEGYGSTTDANTRWPDFLARRLLASRNDLGVVNAGISGNRVLNDELGPNAQSRLDRDLLLQAGAKYAILLEGINDIQFPETTGFLPPTVNVEPITAQDLIAGYKQIVRRAHAQGIRIFAGTILPASQDTREAGPESKRLAVNEWLRSEQSPFDGVIDFDAALRDPEDPTRILPAFDSGDTIHPNDAGYEAMAEAIDLTLFEQKESAN